MLAVFLDTETTGLDPLVHSPIDIAIKVIDTKTGHQVGEYHTIIKISLEKWELRDLDSAEITGATWEKTQQGKDIGLVSSEIKSLFLSLGIDRKNAFFICQNPSFDRGFFSHIVPVYEQEKLHWPYHWLDLASMYWAAVNLIPEKMPKKISFSKNAISEHYHIPPENRPHLAINGVDHLIQCYRAVLTTRKPTMKLKFLGAAETVTGSKYLLTTEDRTILIDCGLFQGKKELRLRNWNHLPIDVKHINAVVLTHAHMDHSGYLPLLVKHGYRGPIYATPGTRDLCEILLRDSGRLQEEDAKHANKHGFSKHKPALPLYTEDDAIEALKYFKTVNFGEELKLGKTLNVTMKPAGHILGSSILTFHSEDETLVFSGDLGRPNDLVMKPPQPIEEADYLVLESTYGNRLHPKTDPVAQLKEIILSAINKGGHVLIPSFAVGRTQTVLDIIYQLKKARAIPDIPIYLDSPMAQDATDLLCKFNSEHKLPVGICKDVCDVAQYVTTSGESKKLNNITTPSVIIAGSGMAEGGRVLHHLIWMAPDPKNTILFTGFQSPMTRGDRLLRGEKEIKIFGQMVPVRAQIAELENLSSHADYEEILSWLKNFKKPPKMVYLTHGEVEAATALKNIIETKLNWLVTIPSYLEEITL